MLRPSGLVLALLLSAGSALAADLREEAEASLRKGVAFFESTHVHGGYPYFATPDLTRRWGESPLGADEIEVQPPGTPAVGQAFLRAYRVTGDQQALAAAQAAAKALIRGQNRHGGWAHTINLAGPVSEVVSFDDNQTQSAVSFLLAMEQTRADPALTAAIRRALEMMVATQLPNGGWPHLYPEQGNYHDFATFNDGGINDCIRVMIEAHEQYPHDRTIERSLRRVARFLQISQLPPPQPGWAQQYNEFLQPAWARSFEPPSVCPTVTVRNINSLIDLYVALGDETLLEPIPDSLRWLHEVRLGNGRWARFVELGTNRPLYYDRGRIRVNGPEDLHLERRSGYAYEIELESAVAASEQRFNQARRLGVNGLKEAERAEPDAAEAMRRREALAGDVQRIIAEQDPSGAWITRGSRFRRPTPPGERWNGEYEVADRIGSAVFNRNVSVLCEYLELSAELEPR